MARSCSIAASQIVVALLVSCFSEPSGTPSDCTLGAIGCQCLPDNVCESSELACRDAYCTPVSCEPGEKYCQCDAGLCDDALMCQDGAICLPPAGGDDATSATLTTTDATEGTSAATTGESTTGSSTTTTMTTSADTGTPLPFCDATPAAIFCGDFDDGAYDPGFAAPVMRGGGTVEVLEDAMAASPPYALRVSLPVSGDETGGLLAASYDAPLPFVGTARAAVRFEPGCFDGGAPERRVLALSFYAPGGGFVGGVRIETTAAGGRLYQVDDADAVIAMLTLDELEVTDTWMELELGIDTTTGNASVRVDGEAWVGRLTPMPMDIVPYITVGPIGDSNPTACTVWFDDIAVLP